MPSVFQPEFQPRENTPAPFTARSASIGRQAGAQELGASLFELRTGEAISPLHFHHGNEELVVVLAGRPTLRTLHDSRQLEPGEVLACPAGPEGAHRLDNLDHEPARVLIVSTMRGPDVIEYPDSEKVMARSQAPGTRPPDPDALRIVVRREAAVDYFEGEA